MSDFISNFNTEIFVLAVSLVRSKNDNTRQSMMIAVKSNSTFIQLIFP